MGVALVIRLISLSSHLFEQFLVRAISLSHRSSPPHMITSDSLFMMTSDPLAFFFDSDIYIHIYTYIYIHIYMYIYICIERERERERDNVVY